MRYVDIVWLRLMSSSVDCGLVGFTKIWQNDNSIWTLKPIYNLEALDCDVESSKELCQDPVGGSVLVAFLGVGGF